MAQKYKDSFLYRYAEGKVNKPIVYICLIEMESALISTLRKQLVDDALPVFHNHLPQRWTKELLKAVIVVNEQR